MAPTRWCKVYLVGGSIPPGPTLREEEKRKEEERDEEKKSCEERRAEVKRREEMKKCETRRKKNQKELFVSPLLPEESVCL